MNRNNKISRNYLKKKAHEFDLETIFILNLNNESLNDLGCIGNCVNLLFLDLSNNNLNSVMALRQLSFLKKLDLSRNRLSALSGLEHLESLKTLNVSGNFLGSIDCLLPLTKIPDLKSLTLKNGSLSNPLCNNTENVNHDILNMLPKLELLDGESCIGYGKEFDLMCSSVENVSKEYAELLNIDLLNQNLPYYPEPSYIRIGMEENDVYEKACKVCFECEELSKKLHKQLSV